MTNQILLLNEKKKINPENIESINHTFYVTMREPEESCL